MSRKLCKAELQLLANVKVRTQLNHILRFKFDMKIESQSITYG